MSNEDKPPVKVSTARQGDRVVFRHPTGYGDKRVARLSVRTVAKASRISLSVSGVWFRRNGTPMRQSYYRLLDPTPEVLAELRTWLDKDAAETKRRSDEDAAVRLERERRAKAAAGWLAAAGDPQVIYESMIEQVLNDVYAELVRTGRLAEAPRDEAHPAPV